MSVKRDNLARPLLVGQLLDEKKKGLSGAPLRLRLPNGRELVWQTDDKGQFRRQTKGWPRKGNYQLLYKGCRRYAPALKTRALDLSRVDLNIKIELPAPLPSGSKAFAIQARLSYQNQPLKRFPLTLLLSSGSGNQKQLLPQGFQRGQEQLWPLMTLRSDRQGDIRFVWRGKPLSGPTQLKFALQYKGNRFFLPQKKELTLVVLAPPVSEWTQWMGLIWVGLLVAVGLGALGWRARRWWLERRELLAAQAQRGQESASEEIVLAPIEGLSAAPPGKQDMFIAGWALDTDDGAPIPGAEVLIQWQPPSAQQLLALREKGEETPPTPDDPQTWNQQLQADIYGRFVFDCTGRPGTYVLKVGHPAYQLREQPVILPHSGQHRRIKVRLISYRHLIFQAFTKGAQALAPEHAFDPKHRTARELLSALEPARRQRLRPLASLFEEAYYGPRMPGASLHHQATEQLSALQPTPQAAAVDKKAESHASPGQRQLR